MTHSNIDDQASARPSIVMLLHVADWKLSDAEVAVSPSIHLGRLQGTAIERLYHHLCETIGVDDGEPLTYTAYVLFAPTSDAAYLLDYSDSYSVVERFANILAVTFGRPLMWSRVIWSKDGFLTSGGTGELHYAGRQTDFLEQGTLSFDADSVDHIRTMWSNVNRIWNAGSADARLTSALQYFYLAWRAHYIEHVCLHLAVAIETLFAPHSHSETTHQLSFNLAHFHGINHTDRERLYRLAKRFHGLRSSVVHGGRPDGDELIEVVVPMFQTIAAVLRTILLDEKLCSVFESDSRRKALWEDYLFSDRVPVV